MIGIIALVLLIPTTFGEEARACLTPYKENGSCKLFSKCQVVVTALNTGEEGAIRFYLDSKCGCDGGKVCCGTLNTKPYPQLVNCAPTPSLMQIELSSLSDESICGLDSSTDRILGGDLVTAESFPWLAALEYKNKFTNANAGIRCGGSIIAKRFILTAAHCILDVEFKIIKVWLGVTNISSEETCSNINGNIRCLKSVRKLNVDETHPHELYDRFNKFNDIGLLELYDDIEFTEYIRPICLPDRYSQSPSSGTYFTVAGWGVTENGIASQVKLKVEVPLRDNNICKDYLSKRYRNITSKQLCVGGERGKDSCEGDSGGPLMYKFVGANGDAQWFQQGIVSYGTGCGVQGRPGVYTKVSEYVLWIAKFEQDPFLKLKNVPCRFYDGTMGTCVELNRCHEFYKRIFTRAQYYTYQNFRPCVQENTPIVCCKNPGSIISVDFNTTAVFPDKTTCGIVKQKLGIKDDVANFPWIVGIEVSTKPENHTEIRCIGTIIHSRYVLTSSKCIFGEEDDTFEPIYVWLGHWNSSWNNGNPVQKIRIKKIIPYSRHYGSFASDITLILLENRIQFSDYISPICLDSPNVPRPGSGTNMTTVWLKNSSRTNPITSSDIMFKHELPLISCLSNTHECIIGIRKDACRDTHRTKNPDTLPYVYGAPVMRKYENRESGRTQWYLVAMDDPDSNYCNEIVYNAVVINSLDWIVSFVSDYN